MRNKDYEIALISWYMRELEGTFDEFIQSLPEVPTAKERHMFQNTLWRIRDKGIVEAIGYCRHFMNYRVTETITEERGTPCN